MDQSMPARRGRPPFEVTYQRTRALALAGSLASAWPVAQPVKRESGPRFTVIDYRSCAVCDVPFVVRVPNKGYRKTCGAVSCIREYRRRMRNARKRNREHLERTAYSDITLEQELAMRREARKCPMPGCGVRLTDEPGLPSSKHLDHIVPLAVGGTHALGNVRITCAACNVRRPRDGSDYAGPVTLWAVIPGVAPRPDRRVGRKREAS